MRVVKETIAALSSEIMDGKPPGPEADVRPGRSGSPSASESDRSKARVLVVEDHAFVRKALVGLINGQTDLVCCGEADSIAGAAQLAAKDEPDAVLLDLRLKDGEALELISSLKFQWPRLRILVLSQCEEMLYAGKVLRAGANGFLMKQEAAEEVLNALRIVLAGQIYLSQAMNAHFQGQPPSASGSAQIPSSCAPTAKFSTDQRPSP